MIVDNYIKHYCINSINVLIYNDLDNNNLFFKNSNNIINLVIESMLIKDVKLNEYLFPHLKSIGIFKNIYNYDYKNINSIENKNDININNINNIDLSISYDLLIINSKNKNTCINVINKYLNNITENIVVLNNLKYSFNYKHWVLEQINSDISVLKYNNNLFHNNNHKNICNFYELIHIFDTIINNNFDYFLIKSSCLGCVRNRNHIVFCDTIHIAINNKYINNILKLNTNFEKYKIKLIYNKTENYILLKLMNVANIKIHFYIVENHMIIIRNNKEKSISINEIGNLKKYNYGPIRINSVEYPYNYLQK